MIYTKTTETVHDLTGDRENDAGIDFYVDSTWNDGKPYIIRIGEQVNIPSNIRVKLSNKNQVLLLENKSGVAHKKGLCRLACAIDFSYRGICHVNLAKVCKGTEDIRVRRRGLLGWLGFKEWAAVINPGEKIIQGIIYQTSSESIIQVSEKEYEKGPKTKRGAGGFGSTGIK